MTDLWAYETPLEQVPEGVTLDPRVIEINGMKFQKRSDCDYQLDYYQLMDRIAICRQYGPEMRKKYPLRNELNLYRNYIQQDLWFIIYFVCKNPLANHPFVVQACKDIQFETGDSLEEWARDHLKTTIISVGRQIQKVLNDPERRIAIFSAVRPLAVKIQNLIKLILEQAFLVKCFPDILYEDPYKEAEKWTEAPEGGLIVKRKGFHKEPTFASYGLVEGMPAGPHHTDLVYDDIETQEYSTPEIIDKVCENFELSWNLGSRGAQRTVVGTPYRHNGPLRYIAALKDPISGIPSFKNRKKPATVDGSYRGKSVFLPEEELARKRAGRIYIFFCQQLVNPTPQGQEKLNKSHLILLPKEKLPQNLHKFMLIDGAGDKGRRIDREADAWAFAVVGVEPYMDYLGLSRMFILDLVIDKMDLIQAQKTAVEMYCRNGYIIKLGIEKVAMSTTEIHIASALRAKKRFVSVEQGNLEILKPGGRSKQFRIENAWSVPLANGKWHIADTIPVAYRARLGMEMEKFPAWEDDGLDGISYIYDMILNYKFPPLPVEQKPLNKYDEAFKRAREAQRGSNGWQSV
jgi:hypothetical protein